MPKKKIKPTVGHLKAAKLLVQSLSDINGKPPTKGEILAKAGYSKETQDNPQQIMNSQGFQLAVERELSVMQRALEKQGINDEALALKLGALLNSENETTSLNTAKEIFKIRGDYAATKVEQHHTGTIQHEFSNDNGDYAEFKKRQLQTREIEEGEIVG